MVKNRNKIDNYKNLLILEMKNLGANESDLLLITDIIVENALENDRDPKDVAWAILQ